MRPQFSNETRIELGQLADLVWRQSFSFRFIAVLIPFMAVCALGGLVNTMGSLHLPGPAQHVLWLMVWL